LQLFDKKFKLCNEDSVDLKGAIKKLSGVNYDDLIKDSRTELARTQTELSVKERNTSEVEEDFSSVSSEFESLKKEVSNEPESLKNYKDSCDKIQNCISTIEEINLNIENKSNTFEENKSLLEKIDTFLNSFNIDFFNEQKDFINEKQFELDEIATKISSFKDKKSSIDNKLDLLKRVPCNLSLRQVCHFVKDAHHAVQDIKRVEIQLNQLSLVQKTLFRKIEELEPEKVSNYIKKYYMVLDKKASLKENISKLELGIEKDKVKILQLTSALEELQKNQNLFEENKKSIERLSRLTEISW